MYYLRPVRRTDDSWAGLTSRVTNRSNASVDAEAGPLLRSRGDDRTSGIVGSNGSVALSDGLVWAVVLPGASTARRERLLGGARSDGLERTVVLPGAGAARSVGGSRGGAFTAGAVERAILVDALGARAQDG